MSSEIPGYRDKCIEFDPPGEGGSFSHSSVLPLFNLPGLPFQKLLHP